MVKMDLMDEDRVKAFIEEVRPKYLIHSAAQRMPDKVEGDFENSKKLNVTATRVIADAMSMYF